MAVHEGKGGGWAWLSGCFAVLIFVDQPDIGVEEPPHLVAETGVFSTAAAVDIERSHELGKRRTQDELAAFGLHGFGAHPGQQQSGKIA